MTMHTNSLPFQVSGAQPQRAPVLPGAASDGGKAFGDTLSRELAQRQHLTQQQAPVPAAAQNKPAQPNKAQSADRPAQAQRSAVREAAKPAQPNEAAQDKGAEAAGEAAEQAEDAAGAAAAAQAAATPVTDMLAYMASLAQPAPATPAAPGAEAAQDALPAGGGAALDLAALATPLAGDGAATVAADDPLAQDANAGLALASGVQQAPAELRTAQQGATLETALPKAQLDAVQFQAQLREATQQAATQEATPAITQLQAQAARLEAVQNPAAMADRIPARVGTQAWDNQVSQRIVYMLGKEQAATLTLNPPDLGPVQVVLNVSNDQASVAFSSNQMEVRQALENAIPRLREMMSESGIALGNATVDAGMPDQRQASQDGAERRSGGHGLTGSGRDGGASASEGAPRATRTVALGERGMVDTFA
ncbi:flagellar hook-length control protein FliK [Massilia niastensis]|uniref:flagellar hook-length control protein FliK n=1 Tax=Massilia niastensis TaxID=544911 RepID=UPI000366576F|nr:flagellar hook-length control protein FliK [Massilia niastensis]